MYAPYDLLIRYALIIDGARRPRYAGDIGVRGGRIADIGELRKARGEREIDAQARPRSERRLADHAFSAVVDHNRSWPPAPGTCNSSRKAEFLQQQDLRHPRFIDARRRIQSAMAATVRRLPSRAIRTNTGVPLLHLVLAIATRS
jgi:hypothetical protein